MTTPVQLTQLLCVASRGSDAIDGRQYLPPPSNPATSGAWSLCTTFGGGGRTQVWGMAAHNGAMVFGVGGDDDGAAQLWILQGTVWTNVTPPWSNMMRVPTILSDGGYIYAGTASRSGAAQIWRSGDYGISWSLYQNFGDAVGHLLSLTAWGGHIYVGALRRTANGEVWSSSNNWIAPIWTSSAKYVYSLKVHNNELHAGTGYPAEVFKFDGAAFNQISNFNNPDLLIVETMSTYRGDLVIGFGRNYWADPAPPCVMSFNGVSWEEVGESQPGEWRTSHNFNASIVVNDTLFMSMGSNYGGISLWALQDGKSWVKVGGRPTPFGPDITGVTFKAEWIYRLVWDGTDLYVSFASIPTSTQPAIWKYRP